MAMSAARVPTAHIVIPIAPSMIVARRGSRPGWRRAPRRRTGPSRIASRFGESHDAPPSGSTATVARGGHRRPRAEDPRHAGPTAGDRDAVPGVGGEEGQERAALVGTSARSARESARHGSIRSRRGPRRVDAPPGGHEPSTRTVPHGPRPTRWCPARRSATGRRGSTRRCRTREEPDRRRHVLVGERGPRDVDELPTPLVVEGPELRTQPVDDRVDAAEARPRPHVGRRGRAERGEVAADERVDVGVGLHRRAEPRLEGRDLGRPARPSPDTPRRASPARSGAGTSRSRASSRRGPATARPSAGLARPAFRGASSSSDRYQATRSSRSTVAAARLNGPCAKKCRSTTGWISGQIGEGVPRRHEVQRAADSVIRTASRASSAPPRRSGGARRSASRPRRRGHEAPAPASRRAVRPRRSGGTRRRRSNPAARATPG